MEGLLLLNTILKHHANSYKHIYTKTPNQRPYETAPSLGERRRGSKAAFGARSKQCSLRFSPFPTLPTSRTAVLTQGHRGGNPRSRPKAGTEREADVEPHDSTCSQSWVSRCRGTLGLTAPVPGGCVMMGPVPNPPEPAPDCTHERPKGAGAPLVSPLLTRARPASPPFSKAHFQGTVQNNLNPRVFVSNGQTVLEHEEIPPALLPPGPPQISPGITEVSVSRGPS